MALLVTVIDRQFAVLCIGGLFACADCTETILNYNHFRKLFNRQSASLCHYRIGILFPIITDCFWILVSMPCYISSTLFGIFGSPRSLIFFLTLLTLGVPNSLGQVKIVYHFAIFAF